MSLYKQFSTDKAMETSGIELEYPNEDGAPSTIIRIARAGGANERYGKVLAHKCKPFRRQIQTETISPEKMDQIMMETYAETVMLGWENLDFEKTENGEAEKNVEFTHGNCIRLFKDLPELWADIQSQATKVALFRKEDLEADGKN
jgi:hypothetical protein